tara:strand:+ start:6817 stop:8331 length:1515 start_codon:yes stop_codon:yes gene_type:complete
MKSTVYLVGAGPGDPGLITVKGIELISDADAIVYDYLANDSFLKLTKKECKVIYAGKGLGFKALSQKQINKKLIDLSKSGLQKIVRLKGGDPFLFGRGGEEAEELKKNKINFEIIPGVSSAIAVPAYAGIPVTHRDITSAFAIVTGHEDPEKNKSSIDWGALSKMKSIVFLMGTKNLKKNLNSLVANGMSKKTKIAAINWGTYSSQKTVIGTFEDIHKKISLHEIKSPSIIVIGEICKLRKKLNWFEKKPLFGKNIVVTRARKNASILSQEIINLGGNSIEIPTIEIKSKPSNYIQKNIKNIDNYDWLIFTSVNGVEIFFDQFIKKYKDIRMLGNVRIAAIGSETARAIAKLKINVDLVPKTFTAEGLVDSFKIKQIKNSRILIPRAQLARDTLVKQLRSMSNTVRELKIYDTVLPTIESKREIQKRVYKNNIDYITFTSSSTVDNFFKYISPLQIKKQKRIAYVCIGPITAKTLRKYKIKPSLICNKYTIDNLVKEIVKFNKK